MPAVPPFNDTKDNITTFRSARSVSGSDLSAIDPYRQGIELQTSNQYYLGTVKIHSGYPDHELPQTEFGQSEVRIEDANWYHEVDTFDVLSFMGYRSETGMTSSVLHTYNGTFPRISSNAGRQPDVAMDGALEPFAIRSRASFFTIEAPFESHDVKGSITDGNEEKDGSCDQIVTVYELNNNPNESTFLDSADTIGQMMIVGDFEPAPNHIIPWRDRLTSSGSLISSNMDSALAAIVQALGSAQENYIPEGRRSMPTGFIYETREGTDSLAFGGFTYFSASVSLPPTV